MNLINCALHDLNTYVTAGCLLPLAFGISGSQSPLFSLLFFIVNSAKMSINRGNKGFVVLSYCLCYTNHSICCQPINNNNGQSNLDYRETATKFEPDAELG